MQNEIRPGSDSIELTWTPRWQLSLAAMTEIVTKGEKSTASVKHTITSQEEKVRLIKTGI